MNRLYVCDQGSSGIAILDLRLREMQMFVPKGYGQLQLPLNCCVDDKGWLYVADAGRKQVVIFDNALQYIAALGEGEGFKPNDVAVGNGRIWVADAKGNRICVYDQSTRELLYSFPQAIKGDPGFVYIPTNIVVTDEQVFVSDMGDFGVKEYTHKGEFLGKLGSHGNRPGQFARPKGIAVDKEGNLFVADAGFENVQVFNRDRTLLMYFGGPYQGPGDMYLPAKVCVDYGNLDYFRDLVDSRFDLRYLIYVTNQYGPDKIGVYGFVELRK
ncbi:MAG: hypothetical protein IH599_04405 [Bacteroidales bacterium]|nr:hypothetical protein [Bacteroidales bacterium]